MGKILILLLYNYQNVNYYYQSFLPGLGEFYQYAVELNLMKGDTIKARDIQRKKDLLQGN